MLRQNHRHGIADLPECRRRRARKTDMVAKRLEPSCLANSQRPVLGGMNIPVAILGNMCCDGAAELIPIKPIVFVFKDVMAIAAQLFIYL
jgi:hypothetical protein